MEAEQLTRRKYQMIALICAIVLSIVTTLPMLLKNDSLTFGNFIKWFGLNLFLMTSLSCVLFSHRFASGRFQEWLFTLCCASLIAFFIGFGVFALILNNFNFGNFDWYGPLLRAMSWDFRFIGLHLIVLIAFLSIYFGFIDRQMWRSLRSYGLRGRGKLKQVEENLENSRWMKDEEKKKIFKPYKYSELSKVKKDGVPVMAELTPDGKDLKILFNSPCHSIIIGSTGSGKTTTFVNPMIQLLAASSAGSSMIMTDPKGELFSLHSGFLKERGYDVKVIDLRDTYSSYRWNPLDSIWDHYQDYVNAQDNVYLRRDSVEKSGLTINGTLEDYKNIDKWYQFDGKAYYDYEKLKTAIKIYKKKVFDEVYEDLNDLVSALVPVENEKDPMWEKGARAITLATLLAMLEDSQDKRLNMTKEKFNFFNLAKILQNSNDDYLELRRYFSARNPLSKALSLSKQVCDAAESTRASYMSIVYEKLTMFNDSGICALTSASDFIPENLADRPTALFLKIPDEKDTRYNLAAIFMLSIYKALIKIASSYEDLSLPRNVYYILDEFANMPKIDKFDKMITVGRSRKIWFNMIIQSYAQLNNVYGDKVADIVKGNCGIKMFIGSNDMGTCKEYSELCGNITVATNSTSGSGFSKDINVSSQMQVRPLIYPSELQRLNHPGDIGHSIVVTFGNFPLMTYFSPSFKVPFYKMGKMDTGELNDRIFDEKAVFYNIADRNQILEDDQNAKKEKAEKEKAETENAEENGTENNSTENSSSSNEESSDNNTTSGGMKEDDIETISDEKIETENAEAENTEILTENNAEANKLLKLWHEFKQNNPDVKMEDVFKSLQTQKSYYTNNKNNIGGKR